jgi:hypothetical protein
MSYRKTTVGTALALGLVMALSIGAAAERPKKKKEASSLSILDSTEAQWGRRAVNDSVYRDYTVNAVYFERGRQRLPDSFKMYKPTPIGADSVGHSGGETPTTMTVNGKEQKLQDD